MFQATKMFDVGLGSKIFERLNRSQECVDICQAKGKNVNRVGLCLIKQSLI